MGSVMDQLHDWLRSTTEARESRSLHWCDVDDTINKPHNQCRLQPCFNSFWLDLHYLVCLLFFYFSLIVVLFYILQLVWSDANNRLYTRWLCRLKPSSMWTGSGVEKSPPQRRAVSRLILEMKHFTPSLCFLSLPRHRRLHQREPSITFMSIAWPMKWLLILEGFTIFPVITLSSSFLKELVRRIFEPKGLTQINKLYSIL